MTEQRADGITIDDQPVQQGAMTGHPDGTEHRIAGPKAGRRGMLTKVLGATAAAAVLTVAKEAGTAHAEAAATLVGPSTNLYGVAASPGAGAPLLPSLGGHTFGVVGSLSNATPSPDVSAGVLGLGNASEGVQGKSFGHFGVHGYSRDYVGVGGLSSSLYGVWGVSPGNTGVKGESTTQFGVHGASQSHAGVGGIVQSASGYGVWGQSTAGIGVFGNSVNNIGVYANSTTTSAVYATSPARGVWGRSTNGIGVLAQAVQGGTVQNRSYGLYAAAPGPGWAGYFEGNVFVTGGVFTPVGQLSMAQAADGSQRTLYGQDSTEPVVEDFGSGTLANGVAEVKLDPDFAAVVTSDAYMVFLTEEGAHNALFVEKKTPAGFTVRAQGAPTATGAFVYRVVAKRKGATGKRLERVERPKGLSASELAPPKLPEAPTQPEKPPTAPKPEPPTTRPPTAR